MKKNNTQQEILLLTGTWFAQRQWVEKDMDEEGGFSTKDLLEKACWDGLIKDILPEVDVTLVPGKKLWLWQIMPTKSFLELRLSDFPVPIDNCDSIDPYSFLKTACKN
jgi:hypothetical protein